MTRFMWDQNPGLKIVYIPCDPIYTHISSTAYRELELIKEGSGYEYLAREHNSFKLTSNLLERPADDEIKNNL